MKTIRAGLCSTENSFHTSVYSTWLDWTTAIQHDLRRRRTVVWRRWCWVRTVSRWVTRWTADHPRWSWRDSRTSWWARWPADLPQRHHQTLMMIRSHSIAGAALAVKSQIKARLSSHGNQSINQPTSQSRNV